MVQGDSRSVATDRAIFTSDTAVRLSQKPQALELQHSGNKIRDLPSPLLTTFLSAALQREVMSPEEIMSPDEVTTPGHLVSDMYVYV